MSSRSCGRLAGTFLLFVQFVTTLTAQNWPQWRGPSSQGVSPESGLPTQWGPGENIAWRVSLAGLGASSPVVWQERVFVTSQVGTMTPREGSHPRLARDEPTLAVRESPIGGRSQHSPAGGEVFLVIQAFDKSDGSLVWEYRVAARGEYPGLHEKHNLATPTPATDGELVYVWFGNGQVLALDLDGRVAWERHLGVEHGSFLNQWGHGSSPVLHGDLLILLCDHKPNAYLLALDKRTGEQRWKLDRGTGRVSHSTPLIVRGPRGSELIVNSSERIDAFSVDSGRQLWYAGSPRQTPIPSPVFDGQLVYLSRGYRNSDFLAIRPGGQGDVSESHVVWRTAGGASYVPSILLYEDLLYVTNEVGVVTCAEANTGSRVWRHRLGGIFYASPVAGDGKVYLLSETGETFVLRAGREPQVLARNHLDERFIASPAISGGHLFLRSDESLYCIGR